MSRTARFRSLGEFCLATLALWTLLEVFFRLVAVDEWFGVEPGIPIYPQYEDWVLPRYSEFERALYRFDTELMYRLEPGVVLRATNYLAPEETWTITIDDRGFRRTSDADPSGDELLVMGDSIAFGFWGSDEESFPSQMAQALASSSPGIRLDVLNAGVPGYDSLQGRLYFSELWKRHSPRVVILAYGMNDHWRKHRSRKEILEDFRRTAAIVQILNHFELFRSTRRIVAHHRQQRAAPKRVPAVSPDDFEDNLRFMIERSLEAGASVILVDTFVFVEAPKHTGRLTALSREYSLPLLHFSELLDRELERRSGDDPKSEAQVYWERVHPKAFFFELVGTELAKQVQSVLAINAEFPLGD